MGHKDKPAAAFHYVVQGAQRCIYSVWITDFPLFHYIMVDADQNDFVENIRVLYQRQPGIDCLHLYLAPSNVDM